MAAPTTTVTAGTRARVIRASATGPVSSSATASRSMDRRSGWARAAPRRPEQLDDGQHHREGDLRGSPPAPRPTPHPGRRAPRAGVPGIRGPAAPPRARAGRRRRRALGRAGHATSLGTTAAAGRPAGGGGAPTPPGVRGAIGRPGRRLNPPPASRRPRVGTFPDRAATTTNRSAEMPEEPGVTEQEPARLEGPARTRSGSTGLAGVALLPPSAGGGQPAAAHVHGSSDAKTQVQLAQVRAATAKFHRVERGGRGRLRARVGERRRREDRRGLRLAPDGGRDGLPLLQRGPDGRQRRQRPEPEVLVYAPDGDGGLELAAVEWVVRSAQSNPPGVSSAPSVLGMPMHILVPPPGPAFYLTHAWVWRTTRPACSPTGTRTSTADWLGGRAGGTSGPWLRTGTFTFAPLRMWCEGEGFGIGRESWCGWCGGAA